MELGIGNVPLVTQFKLHTFILHVTSIAKGLGLTHVGGDGHGDNHTVGLFDEVVNGEGEGVVEEAEVET